MKYNQLWEEFMVSFPKATLQQILEFAGRQPGDMIFTVFSVVSKRFVEVLESCQATGYRAFPIRIVGKKAIRFPITSYSS